MSRKILIVGGVAGGASAAARLRRLDENAEIIMFERGNEISFANCGLPYYLGGVIKNRDDLLLQTPESFGKRFNVDVRVNCEVVNIDRKKKQVEVADLLTGKKYFEGYDKLILSPGAEPVRLPIPGVDSDRIFTLRNMSDTDRIVEFINANKPQKAVVIGAGYIGLEMAENLKSRNLSVEIVEMLDQVMPLLDREMADYLHRHLKEHSVGLRLGEKVCSFEQSGSSLKVKLNSGEAIDCDFALLATGVRRQAGDKAG